MFGLSTGPAPDRFLVGLATLTLFAEVAEQQPLVCIVDDAQWLDHASAQILGFVARRLLAERIALVCAARTGSGDDVLAGLPELPIGGLGDSDARALLLDNVHGPLDAAVCDQIVTESHGNPLALLELPRTWNAAELAGGFGLPGSQPVAGKIEQSYARRLVDCSLPTPSCSSSPRPQSRSATRCCCTVPPRRSASTWLRPALRWTPGCSRSAGASSSRTRSSAPPPTARQRPTTATACIARWPRPPTPKRTRTGAPGTAPERRLGPDEEVAAELERSAGRAQARGGVAAAAAFLQRAVALTVDPARRAERALAAAQASLQAGAFDAALALLATAEAGPLDEFQRARVGPPARPASRSPRASRSDAPPLLLKAARRLEPFDLELARETYLTAWGAATIAGHLGGRDVLLEICRAVQALPPPTGCSASSRPAARRPRAADHRRTRRRDSDAAESGARPGRDPRRGRAALGHGWPWLPSALVWDIEGMLAISATTGPARSRRRRALSQLPGFLHMLGLARAWMGDFAGAAAADGGGRERRRGDGIPHRALHAGCGSGRCKGGKPRPPRAIASAIRHAEAQGQGLSAIYAEWASAVLYNGLARYEEAPCARPGEPPPTPSSHGTPCGRCPSSSRRPRARETPSSQSMRSSDWRGRRSPAATISPSASRRAAARC